MAKFMDLLKREWELRITLGLLPRLREAGFNVTAKLSDRGGLGSLADDPEVFGRVLYTLCESQAKEKGVTPEQFAEGFDGETIYAATVALMEATADFTQSPKVAKTVKDGLPGILNRAENEQIRKLNTIFSGSINGDGASLES